MQEYRIDVKVYATLYIKAETREEAQRLAVEATTGYGEIGIKGEDSDVMEFSEVGTIHPLDPGDKVEEAD